MIPNKKIDLSNKGIEQIFFTQAKAMSKKTNKKDISYKNTPQIDIMQHLGIKRAC